MSEWKEVRLGEICHYVTDRIDCSVLNKDNYISTENMAQNCGGVSDATNVPDGKCIAFKENDVLFSNIRPYFKKLWKADFDGGCSADVLCIRANNNVNQIYLYYLLTQDSFISYVMKGSKGCKMPRGDKEFNMKWKISIPSLSTQRHIASILSNLDDKIAVNRRICENLEAQAQTLFKHWFIDFAPFKDGKFVASELGMIPEGWRVGTLGNYCESSKDRVSLIKNRYTFLNSSDVTKGIFHVNYQTETTNLPPHARKSIQKDDIIYSDIRPLNRHYAYVYFTPIDYVVSTRFMVIRPTSILSNYRIYQYLCMDRIIEILHQDADSRSGTFPQYNFECISRLKIIVADEKTEKRFGEILERFYKKIFHIQEENLRLSTLRDTLLPKLMSGQIKV